jgi:hypothetical protein
VCQRELTNQELLDRYIHSFKLMLLKLMLPPDKMDDLAAEIRSNLESLAEDRAAELGRELSLGETRRFAPSWKVLAGMGGVDRCSGLVASRVNVDLAKTLHGLAP